MNSGFHDGPLETYLSQVGDDVQHRLMNLPEAAAAEHRNAAVVQDLHMTLHATEIARGILDRSYVPTRAALLDVVGLLKRYGFAVDGPATL